MMSVPVMTDPSGAVFRVCSLSTIGAWHLPEKNVFFDKENIKTCLRLFS